MRGVSGHAFTHDDRHDWWVRTWGSFLSAHQMPVTTEPRAALRGTDLRCYDHFTRTVTGQLVGLDVAIHHPTRPGDMSFSTPRRRLERWEAAKRRLYADSGWPDAPEVPRCVLLVASTFGEIGPSARAFFASVIRLRFSLDDLVSCVFLQGSGFGPLAPPMALALGDFGVLDRLALADQERSNKTTRGLLLTTTRVTNTWFLIACQLTRAC